MTTYDQGAQYLDQLENMLLRLVESDGYPTKKTIIALTRAVMWLMERWVREHDPST